jgi:4,5-dihydroxyphthalate decarboxylase
MHRCDAVGNGRCPRLLQELGLGDQFLRQARRHLGTGADVRYIPLEPEEIFFRMVTNGEFDVCEMSMATFFVTREKGAPFVGIPVFPSRMFRQTGV